MADKKEKRLLLFAEMRLSGEAWLEFRIDENKGLHQTATFRSRGFKGRLYWYSMVPFHNFIFNGMIRNITKNQNTLIVLNKALRTGMNKEKNK